MSAACRSCGDAVVWAEFESGARAPFDDREEITKEGELRWRLEKKVRNRGMIPPVQVIVARRAKVGEPGRLNHFATCPQSTKWRKG